MDDSIPAKNYEEIFIAIVEFIRDNPNCSGTYHENEIMKKFNLTSDQDRAFINAIIVKTTLSLTGDTLRIINPDALFYLMEYRELQHSLKESKAARKQSIISTWFAVAGIVISIFGLAVSIYYSNKQIELSERQSETTINSQTK